MLRVSVVCTLIVCSGLFAELAYANEILTIKAPWDNCSWRLVKHLAIKVPWAKRGAFYDRIDAAFAHDSEIWMIQGFNESVSISVTPKRARTIRLWIEGPPIESHHPEVFSIKAYRCRGSRASWTEYWDRLILAARAL